MGARTILTGLSSEIAQTLVDLGVDLSMMKTVGDLQGGIEEAERLAGYRGAGDAGDAVADAKGTRPPRPNVGSHPPPGDYLIASILSDLSDTEVVELRTELAELVGLATAPVAS